MSIKSTIEPINTTASSIIEKLIALQAFNGDADIRMANEIATLIGDADSNVDVKIVGEEIAIAFAAPENRVANELVPLANDCGYQLYASEMPPVWTFRRPRNYVQRSNFMNSTQAKHASTSEPGAELNAMQQALQDAGVAASPSLEERRAVLDNADATLAQVAADLSAAGVHVEQPQSVYPEATAASEGAGRPPLDDIVEKKEGLSQNAKIAIGVGLGASLAAGLYFGAKHFGIKLPFGGNNGEAVQAVNDVAQQVAAFAKL